MNANELIAGGCCDAADVWMVDVRGAGGGSLDVDIVVKEEVMGAILVQSSLITWTVSIDTRWESLLATCARTI